jgi:hypothetical protein
LPLKRPGHRQVLLTQAVPCASTLTQDSIMVPPTGLIMRPKGGGETPAAMRKSCRYAAK